MLVFSLSASSCGFDAHGSITPPAISQQVEHTSTLLGSTAISTPTRKPTSNVNTPTPIVTTGNSSTPITAISRDLPVSPIPTLGVGSILVQPQNSAHPPIRKYVCPWLDMPGSVPHYSYKVVNSFLHDPGAYTEGLVYQDGDLYESTGLYGRSSLRKVELETGKPVQVYNLPANYFGEGIAINEEQIYMLTWKEQTGFVFDRRTFQLLDHFSYLNEGWGLTIDKTGFIMSNGSDRLIWLDPSEFKPFREIRVRSNGAPVENLNELEYIDGEIWANIYLTSCIARIDPKDGRVLGWLDTYDMLSDEEMTFAEVPNGIAYDILNGRIFVTGKFWPRLFEIELVPQL